jgi:hypothetical protein
VTVTYVIGGTETTLLNGGSITSTSTSSLNSFSISSGLPSLATTAIEFRLYGTNASSTGNFRLDDFSLGGTITAVPEPHEYGIALAGMLMALIVIRHRRKASQIA